VDFWISFKATDWDIDNEDEIMEVIGTSDPQELAPTRLMKKNIETIQRERPRLTKSSARTPPSKPCCSLVLSQVLLVCLSIFSILGGFISGPRL
jgi:hypothetical protein